MIKQTKRRGRPNKIEVQRKKDRNNRNKNEENDIIITLPSCSDDYKDYNHDSNDSNDSNSGNGNGNGDDGNDNDNDNDNEKTKNSEKDYYTINYSDENNDLGYISEDQSSGSYKSVKPDFYLEISERDKLIKKLTQENNNLRKDLEEIKKKGIHLSLGKKELSEKMSKLTILNIVDGNKLILKSKCDIDCIHCTLDISGIPWLMPVSYINGAYYVNSDRIFCSPNCMLRYNDRILNDHRQKIRHGLIIKMYQEIYDTEEILKSALDPEDCLKKFGKEWSPNKFKQNLNLLTYNSKEILPIMIPCITIDEARKNGISCTTVI
jgi:hypothetical protein